MLMEQDKNELMVNEILTRGVGSFIDPDGKFKEKLIKKIKGEYEKDIIVKFGVDPTRPDIHLGHAVAFRKLRQLQNLGCKVVFLVGDFTALIGDPTGKSKVRPELEQAAIEANLKTYLDQVGQILLTDEKYFSWIRNSDWFYNISDIFSGTFQEKAVLFEKTRMQLTHLGKTGVHNVSISNLLWVLKHVTYARLIQRDMFQDRIKSGEELYMHEMLYPVLQGLDSHLIKEIYGSCDLEIGGTDQTFNMHMGRDIMKINNEEQQAVLSVELLVGIDGKEKMSKSLDNYIAITDEPSNMFGKIMSVPDSAIVKYFELATYTPIDEIKEIEKNISSEKVNPKDIKMRLAKEVVAMYYGDKKADEAEENFVGTFQKGGIPEDIQTTQASTQDELSDILVKENVVSSKTEWRRLVEEGGVTLFEEGGFNKKIEDPKFKIIEDLVIKIGKRRFIKINIRK